MVEVKKNRKYSPDLFSALTLLDTDKQRYNYLNYFILVAFSTQVFGVAINLYRGFDEFALSIMIFLIPNLISFRLNKAGKSDAAMHTFFISINLFMFHSALCFSRDSGLYLFYFTFLTGYALYFGFERIKTLSRTALGD